MTANSGQRHAVTLVPGDWIGPETCKVVQDVVQALGVQIDWHTFGGSSGDYADAVIASARETGTLLMAKHASTRRAGQLPFTARLRKELGTWATVRAIRALPGAPAVHPGTNLVVIRETSEDIYAGLEHQITDGVYEAVKVTTRGACERIARFAYEYARANGRERVTIVHKSNIMKKSDGLFLRTAQAVARDYPDIETDEVIVDALCMRLVRNPHQFDVLLCGNLFGDIVSDLANGLAGGIVAGASSSYGDGVAIFANPHGRAPELVGKDRANPVPMLRATKHMLRHLGEGAAADRLIAAIEAVTRDGVYTADQGGTAPCSQVRAAILSKL
jgi:isocitrate dehydrogenase (NAD+)